jgi:hypothetical protein
MGRTIARRAASRKLPLRSASRMATLINWIHIGMHRQASPHITFHNTTCTLERWRVAGNRGPAMACLTGLSARNRSGLRSPKLPTITEWKLMCPLSRMRSMSHLTGLRRSSTQTVSFRGQSGIVLLNLRLTDLTPSRHPPDRNPAMQRAPAGSRIRLSTCEQVHNRAVLTELR